jgi:hypothetical protein
LRAACASDAVASRRAVLERLQRCLAAVNPCRLLGQATPPVACRTDLHGMLDSPVAAYWNISKEWGSRLRTAIAVTGVEP